MNNLGSRLTGSSLFSSGGGGGGGGNGGDAGNKIMIGICCLIAIGAFAFAIYSIVSDDSSNSSNNSSGSKPSKLGATLSKSPSCTTCGPPIHAKKESLEDVVQSTRHHALGLHATRHLPPPVQNVVQSQTFQLLDQPADKNTNLAHHATKHDPLARASGNHYIGPTTAFTPSDVLKQTIGSDATLGSRLDLMFHQANTTGMLLPVM